MTANKDSKSFIRSMMPTKLGLRPQDIQDAICHIKDPIAKTTVLESDLVSDIIIAGQRINVTLSVLQKDVPHYEGTRLEIESAIKAIPQAEKAKVLVVLTAHSQSDTNPQDNPLYRGRLALDDIKNIIAIGSGKGGVGKSTTTVNMAYALRDLGYKVGILDADIYGPSIPKMMAINHKPESVKNDRGEDIMLPVEKDGIQLMSMGFLVEEDTPIIWRGPIVQKAIQQFLGKVRWYDLDILLIDMPPGTGDIHLTLVRKANIKGAVVVSTPQDVALIDAKKAIGMFEKVEVPILGLVENMSYFTCPHCDERSEIFSHGGAHDTADKLGVPFMAEVPLKLEIRQKTDNGDQDALVKDIDLGFPYRQAATTLISGLKIDQSPAA